MAFDTAAVQDLAALVAPPLTVHDTDALVDRLGVRDDSDPHRGRPVKKEERLRAMFDELSDEDCLRFIDAALNRHRHVYSGALDDVLAACAGVRIVGRRGAYSLVPTDTTPADPAGVAQETLTCLEANGYKRASRHFQQAVSNFGEGRYEAGNGQLRTALEAVLEEEVARRGGEPVTGRGQLVANADKLGSGRLRRPVDVDIVEHIKTLIKVCHSDGPHPGEADEKEAEFRLIAVSALVRLLTGC